MALLDKIFGRKPSGKEQLIRAMAALRIRADPTAEMMGYSERMLDELSKEQIFSLPEATLVTIVETFVGLRHQGMPGRQAIDAIESFRSKTLGSLEPIRSFSPETAWKPSNPLSNIFDFVAARVALEHSHGAQLDEEFIDNAVHTSASVFGLEIEIPERPPYTTHLQIEVGEYLIVLASYKRRELGYLFPWRLLAFDKSSRGFAFSYNLEVTSVSCCFGSHRSDNSHLNLGEANPDITQAEFEEWALPHLLQSVYGGSLLTEEEVHKFGVEFVVEQIERDGYEVEYIEEDPNVDPQIFALKPDGTPVSIVTRASVFPEKSSLSQKSEQFNLFARESEPDDEIFFAGIGLANADARNDIERRAVTRSGRLHVQYSGLDEC
ncbi:MAG TPA: hypothetical protein VIO59_04070 [Rhodanobacter sp.]